MTGVPWSVRNELDLAVQRTGMTPALTKATARLPVIFNLTPTLLDLLFQGAMVLSGEYKATNLDDLEITEQCVFIE